MGFIETQISDLDIWVADNLLVVFVLCILMIIFLRRSKKKKTAKKMPGKKPGMLRPLEDKEVLLMFVNPEFSTYEKDVIIAKRNRKNPDIVICGNLAWNLKGLTPLKREGDGMELFHVTRDSCNPVDKKWLDGDGKEINFNTALTLELEKQETGEEEEWQPSTFAKLVDEGLLRSAMEALGFNRSAALMYGSMGIVAYMVFQGLLSMVVRVAEARGG